MGEEISNCVEKLNEQRHFHSENEHLMIHLLNLIVYDNYYYYYF